jgi:hypothetical protein
MLVQKVQKKHVFAALGVLLVLAFLVHFAVTWVEHVRMKIYREKMTERTYDVRDLNVYKRIQNTKQQRLSDVKQRYNLDFARSELKAALEKAAEAAGIPVNDVSIEWDRSGESDPYKTLLLNIRVTTTFPQAGVFLSILEGASVGGETVFPFAASIQHFNIAAVKQTGREIAARIQLIVYQKA